MNTTTRVSKIINLFIMHHPLSCPRLSFTFFDHFKKHIHVNSPSLPCIFFVIWKFQSVQASLSLSISNKVNKSPECYLHRVHIDFQLTIDVTNPDLFSKKSENKSP